MTRLECHETTSNNNKTWAGALVYWLWEETHVPKVVSSYHSTVRMLDGNFSHLFVVKFVMSFEKIKKMKKRPGLAIFFKKTITKRLHSVDLL